MIVFMESRHVTTVNIIPQCVTTGDNRIGLAVKELVLVPVGERR